MQLHVAFRDEAGVTTLVGQQHSGGERAVSTIMFLMALQVLCCTVLCIYAICIMMMYDESRSVTSKSRSVTVYCNNMEAGGVEVSIQSGGRDQSGDGRAQ